MADADSSNPTFESAMERLQRIVHQMESDKLPLEEMLERYEEGIRLVQFCGEKLAAAEARIEIITRNAAGKAQIADFETTAAVTPPANTSACKPPKSQPSTKPVPKPDDVSLF